MQCVAATCSSAAARKRNNMTQWRLPLKSRRYPSHIQFHRKHESDEQAEQTGSGTREPTEEEQINARDAADEVMRQMSEKSDGGGDGDGGGDDGDESALGQRRFRVGVLMLIRRAGLSGTSAVALNRLIELATAEQVLDFGSAVVPSIGLTDTVLLSCLCASPVLLFDASTLLSRVKRPNMVFKLPEQQQQSSKQGESTTGTQPAKLPTNDALDDLLAAYQDTCANSNPGSILLLYQQLFIAAVCKTGEETLARGTLLPALGGWFSDRLLEADVGLYGERLDFVSKCASSALLVLISLASRYRSSLLRKVSIQVRGSSGNEETRSAKEMLREYETSDQQDDRTAAVTSLVRGTLRKLRFSVALSALRGILSESAASAAYIASGSSLGAPIVVSVLSEWFYAIALRDVNARWRESMRKMSAQFKAQMQQKLSDQQKQREHTQTEGTAEETGQETDERSAATQQQEDSNQSEYEEQQQMMEELLRLQQAQRKPSSSADGE